MKDVRGKKVAILTEKGFEEAELTSPKQAMEQAGVRVDIVSPEKEKVTGWKNGNWSITLPVDVNVNDASPDDYDGLMIPGGVINPDLMRINPRCVEFAQQFMEAGKPVFAICHGPQLLIETGMLQGRTMTSYYSVKTDIINAGADWQDREVVVDNGLVTSRSPKDLEAFNRKLLEELGEGVHTVSATH